MRDFKTKVTIVTKEMIVAMVTLKKNVDNTTERWYFIISQ